MATVPTSGAGQDEPAPPQDARASEESFFERIRAQGSTVDAALRQNYQRGRAMAPERAARVHRIQTKLGLDSDFIDENLEGFEGRIDSIDDVEKFRREDPWLADLFAKSPLYVAIARPSLGELRNHERTWFRRDDPERPLSDLEVDEMAQRQAAAWLAEDDEVAARGTTSAEFLSRLETSGKPRDVREREYIQRAREQLRTIEKRVEATEPVGFTEAWEWFKTPIVGTVSEAAGMLKLREAIEAHKAGTATPEQLDQVIMHGRLAMALQRRGYAAGSYAAQIIGETPALLTEMLIGSPLYALGKAGAAKALKRVVVDAIKSRAGRAIATAAKGVAGAVAGTAAETPLGLATGRIMTDAVRRQLPGVEITPDAEGKLGAAIDASEGDEELASWVKATYSWGAELFTERAVGAGLEKVLKPVKTAILTKWLQRHPKEGADGFLAALKRTGWNGMAVESVEERVSEFLKIPVDGYVPPSTEQLIGEFAGFLPMGGVSLAGELRASRQRARQNLVDKQQIATILELAKSPAVKNDPEIGAAVLEQFKPDQKLQLPLEIVETYAQGTKGPGGATLDVRDVVTALTGDPKAYDEARGAGTKLPVPAAKFLELIAADEKAAAHFKDEVTTRSDEVSPKELEKAQEELKATEAETSKAAEGERRFEAAMEAIRDDFRTRLAHVGVAPASKLKYGARAVDVHVAIMDAFFRTLARRTKRDPLDLYRRHALRIHRTGVEDIKEPASVAAMPSAAQAPAGAPQQTSAVPEAQPEAGSSPEGPPGAPVAAPGVEVPPESRDVDTPHEGIPIPEIARGPAQEQSSAPAEERYGQPRKAGPPEVPSPGDERLDAVFADLMRNIWNGRVRPTGPIPFMKTPSIYVQLGFPDDPMTITSDVVLDKANMKHGVPLDMLRVLPAHLRNPMMVFKSSSQGEHGALVVVTSQTGMGKAMVAALHRDVPWGGRLVNRVASYHPRESIDHLRNWIADGLLLYQDPQQVERWARHLGLQLPLGQPNADAPKVLGPADVFKDKPAPPPERYEASGDRGFTEFNARFGGSVDINLLANADLTTMLHELGHIYLDVMTGIAADVGASPEVARDLQTLFDWFGVKDLAEWQGLSNAQKKPHHEKFAEGFEKYLMTGKAPTKALRQIFGRIAEWMAMAYKALLGKSEAEALDAEEVFPHINLTPEVTAVFDRLLATVEELEAAEREAGLDKPLFDDPAKYGMTEKQAQVYRNAIEEASAARRGEAIGRNMESIRRRRTKEFEKARAEIKADVTADVDEMPVYQAFYNLRDGTLPDGSPLPLGAPAIKLSEQDIETMGLRGVLPRGLLSKDGVHPDTAAEMFGFGSGESMLQALARMVPREQMIEGMTEERFKQVLQEEPQDPASIYDAAVDALHEENTRRVRRQEREHLMSDAFAKAMGLAQRISGPARTSAADTNAARRTIGAKKWNAIDLGIYRNAEAKASVDARRAFRAGDWQGLEEALRRGILNAALYSAALEGREEGEKIADYVKRLESEEGRAKIGKGDPEALDAMEDLLEGKNFRPRQAQERARKTLAEWRDKKIAEGLDPAIEERLLAATDRGQPWQEMTIDELRAVRVALESIEHTAKRGLEVRRNNDLLSLEVAVREMKERAEAKLDARPGQDDTFLKTWKDRLKDRLVGWDTDLMPMETLIEMLDGGPTGPWHDFVFNPMSDAQGEFYDLQKEITGRVQKLTDRWQKDNVARTTDRLDTPLGPMSRGRLISIALNAGNATGAQSNFDKMLRGHGWSEDQVMAAIARLSKQDLEFVQEVWDTIESLYPRLNEVFRRLSGVPLPKMEARPFTVQTADGPVDMKGGYFPVVYDPKYVAQGKVQETGPLEQLFDPGYERPTVPSSFTQQRTDFAGPLLLDFTSVLSKHLVGVIKHIAYRERLMDVYRILKDPRVSQVLRERLGPEYEAMFIGTKNRPGWLRAVANEHVSSPALDRIDRLAEWTRAQVVVATLGFKVTSALSQTAGLSNALEYLTQHYGARKGSKLLFEAMKEFYGDLPANLAEKGGLREFIDKNSGEMRHRSDTMDRDLGDRMRRLARGEASVLEKATDGVARASMYGIVWMDRLVSYVTWLAGYRGALATGATEEQAAHAGDAAVRRSQGAGGAKDLAALYRQRGVKRLFTMFMTPMAAAYGRLRSIGAKAKREGWRYAPEAIIRAAMVVWLPSVLADLLGGRLPDDDKEKSRARAYAEWIALRAASGGMSTVPLLGAIGHALESVATDGKITETRWSPVASAIDKAMRTTGRAGEAIFGDKEWTDELTWDLFESSGYALGLPTSQASITGEYLNDLLSGEADPAGPADFLHDLLYRRSWRERRGQD